MVSRASRARQTGFFRRDKLWPAIFRNLKVEDLVRNSGFLFETLETRNMLAVPMFPSPTPIELNPDESGLTENSPYDAGGNPLNGGPPGLSSTGVRYYDGSIVAYSEFVRSSGLDGVFSVAAVWTPYSGLATGDNGNNISNTLHPSVKEADTINPWYVVVNGSSTRWFTYTGGIYSPMFFSSDKLSADPMTHEFTYVDPSGNLIGKVQFIQRSGTFNGVTRTERFYYSYNADGRVEKISWDQWDTGTSTWIANRTVEYLYYASGDFYGNVGDLKLATVKDSSAATIDSTYYRYYVSGSSQGLLKYFFRPASYDRLVAAVGDPSSADDAAVAPFADKYFEFDGSSRVSKLVLPGHGSWNPSSGSGLGEYTYIYSDRGDNDPFTKSFNRWRHKTTEVLSDGTSQNIVYANEFGEGMLNVFDDSPLTTNLWRSYTRYDTAGRMIFQADPVAIAGFSETHDDLVNYANPSTNFIADNLGLIAKHTYVLNGGSFTHFESTSIQNGESPTTGDLQYGLTYVAQTNGPVTVFYVASETVYRSLSGTGALTTNFGYSFHLGTVAPKEITITHDAVSTVQNGSGIPNTANYVFNEFGQLIWTRDGDLFVNYIEYDLASGGVTKIIQDVNSFTGLPQVPSWILNGNGKHIASTFEVDFLGRTTKSTDPNGNIDYVVYRDPLHEVRSYIGWSVASLGPTLPTSVLRFDRTSGYLETIAMSAVPNSSNNRPLGTEAISGILNWTRSQTNLAGQIIQEDAYFNIAGLTYSPNVSIGTEGIHFLRDRYSFDNRGRLDRAQDSTGTIRRSVYDPLSRIVSGWIGTDDTPTSGSWSPTNTAGTNLQNTHMDTFDNGGVGDSNLTEAIVQTDAQSYSTKCKYDFRNRLLVVRGPDGVATGYSYSNLGEITQTDVYADADADLVLDLTPASELRGRSVASYDDRMRVYQFSAYEVDPQNGAVSDRLTTNLWYDRRGNLVKSKSPNGLLAKTFVDSLGRQTESILSIDSAETLYADALTATLDKVIEQSSTLYDLGSRPVAALSYKRLESDTTSTGLLNPGNSYRNAAITWFDLADRVTHMTSLGRDDGSTRYVFNTSNAIIDSDSDGIPNEAEGLPRMVNSSNDWITNEVQYDSAGRAFRSIDNLGRISQTLFDVMNRPTAVIQNYVNGLTTASEISTDRQSTYDYDPAGRLSLIHNLNATGTAVQDQVTRTLYESLVDASWATSVIYPDSSDTTSAGTDQVKYFYDSLGRVTQMIDQRGVDRRYNFDSQGRFFKDRVVNSIAGVDVSIRRIELTFDDLSRVKKVTSYDAGTGGNVVNEVEHVYTGYGLIGQTKQAHDGAVGGSTPAINYVYNDGAASGEAKYVRLTSMVYPTGEDTRYIYPTTGIGNSLNRVEAIADTAAAPTTARFAQYTYLGADTIVTITHPAITGGLKLSYGAAGTYAGWDRFGRIVNQQWTNDAGTTTRDRTQYTYDRNSNRLTRTNSQLATLSEVNTFDGLDRLASVTRNGTANQNWVLDSTANWNSFTKAGSSAQTRTHNAANEVLTVSAQTAPIHDAAGNITQAAKPNTPAANQVYVYDGWNRLVQIKETTGTVIATYEYDGRGNRIQKTTGATVRDYFHNDAGQVVEVRVNSVINQTFVWDLSYIDSPVMTRRDTASDGVLDQSYYFAFDALRNVTSLINASNGNVLERYHYDAYGKVQVYNSTWTPLGASAYANLTTFTGRELDSESGLYYFRARYFDPALGRFLNRDPLGYVDGMNLYNAYFIPMGLDPFGLRVALASESSGAGFVRNKDGTWPQGALSNSFEWQRVPKAYGGFSGYAHYLSHPWDMDDDLEYGFYGAIGVAGAAAAGGSVLVAGGLGTITVSEAATAILISNGGQIAIPVVADVSISGVEMAFGIDGPGLVPNPSDLAKPLMQEAGDAAVSIGRKVEKMLGPKAAVILDSGANTVGRGPNRIYSADELIRRGDGAHHGARPNPNHNFPEVFNDAIFNQGTMRRVPGFFRASKPGLSNDSIHYTLPGTINEKIGVFEIFVRPSLSGNTEVITHRFFNPIKH